MFTKYDLETLTIKVLNDNSNYWFEMTELATSVSNFYQKNSDEFFIGHFVFVWEKLLINTNFISSRQLENIKTIQIKIKTSDLDKEYNTFKSNSENKIEQIQFNLPKQIKHMVENKELYAGSKLIEEYLIKYYNFDKFIKFLEIYGECLTPIKKILDLRNNINTFKNNNNLSKNNLIVPAFMFGMLSIGVYYWLKYK